MVRSSALVLVGSGAGQIADSVRAARNRGWGAETYAPSEVYATSKGRAKRGVFREKLGAHSGSSQDADTNVATTTCSRRTGSFRHLGWVRMVRLSDHIGQGRWTNPDCARRLHEGGSKVGVDESDSEVRVTVEVKGESLGDCSSCQTVVLSEPVDERAVIDGVTGDVIAQTGEPC